MPKLFGKKKDKTKADSVPKDKTKPKNKAVLIGHIIPKGGVDKAKAGERVESLCGAVITRAVPQGTPACQQCVVAQLNKDDAKFEADLVAQKRAEYNRGVTAGTEQGAQKTLRDVRRAADERAAEARRAQEEENRRAREEAQRVKYVLMPNGSIRLGHDSGAMTLRGSQIEAVTLAHDGGDWTVDVNSVEVYRNADEAAARGHYEILDRVMHTGHHAIVA